MITSSLTFITANAVRYGTARAEWFLNLVGHFHHLSANELHSWHVRRSSSQMARSSKPADELESQLLVLIPPSCLLVLKALWELSRKVKPTLASRRCLNWDFLLFSDTSSNTSLTHKSGDGTISWRAESCQCRSRDFTVTPRPAYSYELDFVVLLWRVWTHFYRFQSAWSF